MFHLRAQIGTVMLMYAACINWIVSGLQVVHDCVPAPTEAGVSPKGKMTCC